MSRYKKANNPYEYVVYEGFECVEFETTGKYKYKVLVDKDIWEEYLKNFSWTAIPQKNRINVKTSICKQSKAIWRVIAEYVYSELDCWGTTIDHINRNPLDNRKANLKPYNATILNSTNISSKYADKDMQYIFKNGSGYKIHFNLAGETDYTQFSSFKYGTKESALEEAKKYRDTVIIPKRERIIEEMIQKTRNVEFERGLRDKIAAGEIHEIISILEEYGICVKTNPTSPMDNNAL